MRLLTGALLMLLGLATAWAATEPKDPRVWLQLQQDGIHDPEGPGVTVLQQPEEALKEMPPDFQGVGNQVDWVRALNQGVIQPIDNLYEATEVRRLDLDIIMPNTGEMPKVRFPHKAHTDWLDCSNCHDKIFIPKAGGNPTNMFVILAGEYCGRCHGAVSFPLTECRRCHSVAWSEPVKGGPQPLPSRVYEPVTEQVDPRLKQQGGNQ
ncbi:hypothetical protein JYB88_02195 [Shewanella cyperi]|uniref:Cytochrome c7-like domain-containing protein n=1 Tax=Shewanella cyperi TaxID=2814292 RepID=A0A974XNG5_9GAMM|nr:c(7)-type cytochrome triheme domain-containing protein [Shewanella cyperi]QSX30493.1 hypothetical protein JYB88_02195 [Shewanella cyperi]